MPRRVVIAVLLAVLAGGGVRADGADAAHDGLKPGDVLDKGTAAKAEGLLPPEILKHYREGEYQNPIAAWPDDVYNWPEDFHAASEKNPGHYTIGPSGEILDKSTGKQPPYIMGFPFPTIDPADPAAGVQVVWNFFYRTYYFGNLRAESQVNMINPKDIERRLDVDVSFMYYDGVPEDEKVSNPQNFLYQNLVVVKSPSDVNGTAALTWRYRDPGKRDSSWAFVPALRRVRAVSPSNRSDGFLGSDMSQDDGPFFDGKPEDFTWKLTGEADQLRFVDPLNLEGKSGNLWLPNGGWRAQWPDLKFIGYMDPNWHGIAWAPTGAALAKRHFYVVQGVPKDKYYLYGKIELYLDKVSFQGAWNRKFGWKDELLNSTQVMAYNPHTVVRPNGKKDWVQGSNMAYQCSEALKLNRATVAGIKSAPTSGFDGRIVFEPARFALESLSRYGK